MMQVAWPLIINSSAEMGVIFTISLFLGRLSEAARSRGAEVVSTNGRRVMSFL